MFHIGRSGSTVVGDLLGQHSSICWGGELFTKRSVRIALRIGNTIGAHPRAYASHPLVFGPAGLLRAKMLKARGNLYGFETKFFHLSQNHIGLTEYLDRLEAMGFGRIIILKRRNYLRKVVSGVIAKQTNNYYHRSAGWPPLTPIRLDVNAVAIDGGVCPLLDRFATWDERFQMLDDSIRSQKTLKLTYEEDVLDDPLKAYRKVCDFLSLRPETVQIRFGRTNPFSLSDLVTNLDEVERTLAKTRYEWMLYD